MHYSIWPSSTVCDAGLLDLDRSSSFWVHTEGFKLLEKAADWLKISYTASGLKDYTYSSQAIRI